MTSEAEKQVLLHLKSLFGANNNEGDFTIVSSDGEKFKVNSQIVAR